MSTRQERLDYLFGRASAETFQLIEEEVAGEPTGETARFLARLRQRARDPGRVDWLELFRQLPADKADTDLEPQPPPDLPAWASVFWESGPAYFPLVDLIGPLEPEAPANPPEAPPVRNPNEAIPPGYLWKAGLPTPDVSQAATVAVGWAGGLLSVFFRGLLVPAADCLLSVVWCSPRGEPRAVAVADHQAVGALELTPKDERGPVAGDLLLVRHTSDVPGLAEVLLVLRFREGAEPISR